MRRSTWFSPKRATFALLFTFLSVGTALFCLGQDDWKRTLSQPRADAAYYYAYLPTLLLDHDLDFENQYQVTKNWYKLGKTPTGRTSNVFGVGPAIFQAPIFAVGHGIAIITGQRRDGFSSTERWLCLWCSLIASVGALFFAGRFAQRHVGHEWSGIAGAAVAALAGPVCYYAIRQPGYAHPYATFAIAMFVERWDASYVSGGTRSIRTWLVLGTTFGIAVLARPQLATWSVLLAAAAFDDIAKRNRGDLRQSVAGWVVCLVAAFVVFLPQLLVWKALFGSWYVVPQGKGFMRWDDIAWTETLFSSRNGLFPWAPLYAISLVALAGVKQRLRIVPLLVLGVALQAFVNGAAWDWWGGGSFGGRRFDSTYVVFALGTSSLISWTYEAVGKVRAAQGGRRVALAASALLSGVVTIFLLLAQLVITSRTSVVSARIDGGVSAGAVWSQKAGPFGRVASIASYVVTFPVRAAFSVHHSVSLVAYDQLVGVHKLGETFPGLNGLPDKVNDTITKADLSPPHADGIAASSSGLGELTQTSARLLFGLNRGGDVTISVTLDTIANVSLQWDGVLQRGGTASTSLTLSFTDNDPFRGVHELKINGPVGLKVINIDLHAQPR